MKNPRSLRSTLQLICMAIATVALLAPAYEAHATPPAKIPVQGVIKDANDVGVDEPKEVFFTLYADAEGTQVVWSEAQNVAFSQGHFSTRLGVNEPASAEIFQDHHALWLGIAINGDEEMSLVEIGTAPYASFAEYAANAANAETFDGKTADAFATVEHDTPWETITGIPEDVQDGDDDTTYVATEGGGVELVDGSFQLDSRCAADEVLVRDSAGWSCSVLPDTGTAQISEMSFSGNVLEITEGSVSRSVDLSSLSIDVSDSDADPDNELNTSASFSDNVLSITDGGGSVSVDLSSIDVDVNDADADPNNEMNTSFSMSGTTLSIADGGGALSVDLSSLQDGVNDADADPNNEMNTSFSMSGTTLSIADGGGALSVDLSSLQDGVNDADADPNNEMNTSFSMSGTTLSIADGGGALSVDLSSLQDGVNDADADPANEMNTSASLSGTTLSIVDGGGAVSVDLASLRDGVNDSDADPANEMNTSFSLSGSTLSITDGGGALSVDLSSLQGGSYTAGSGIAINSDAISIKDNSITPNMLAWGATLQLPFFPNTPSASCDSGTLGGANYGSTTSGSGRSEYVGSLFYNQTNNDTGLRSNFKRGRLQVNCRGAGTIEVIDSCSTAVATVTCSGGARPWTASSNEFNVSGAKNWNLRVTATAGTLEWANPTIVLY